MENKTIRQLAEELKVSKTAIRKYMNDDFRQTYAKTDDKGVIGITPEGCKLIAETIENNRKPIAETAENTVSDDVLTIPKEVWEALREQITSQKDQILSLQRQNEQLTLALENTTSSLKAAQALHAGTIQQQLEAPAPAEAAITVQEKKKWRWPWRKDKK